MPASDRDPLRTPVGFPPGAPRFETVPAARSLLNPRSGANEKRPQGLTLRATEFWLPPCASTHARTEPIDPEVHFRLLYGPVPERNGIALYREQSIGIALGTKESIGKGIATLACRVPAEGVATAMPPREKPREPRTPRVIEFLRKASEWQTLLQSGKFENQADIAQQEGITRARVTQILSLLRLNPEIQEAILSMPPSYFRTQVTEHALRPIAQFNAREQVEAFRELMGQASIA